MPLVLWKEKQLGWVVLRGWNDKYGTEHRASVIATAVGYTAEIDTNAGIIDVNRP